ncbi:bacillithiol biosynthesis cysteine-adding enzyme BshC [Pontibacillus salipaludis]|uniref:Putative cysteine ligase BshC n=1 Tax=Pontibacillus salipaludis TaxID=1697394 RepID=A0ABQ1Q8H9_9BACI|nr:bacillithiol biosynthesis cysteine-adding enzyme BshC [Pontibacillus salipaludis]GGD19103.1 putative cysteine ligase BshC [Pontibacillus salipaludis]
MRIQPITLPSQNKFIQHYRAQEQELLNKFHYNPYNQEEYERRALELDSRSFQREELADHLQVINKKWGAGEATFSNIERLRNPESVVVVGGQQAGLLTGPLYTIHKMISIIIMAKEQEEALGRPVLPVFWVAGEDHDFDEINHIYMPQSPRMKKHKILQKQMKKEAISEMEMDEEAIQSWLDRLFAGLHESEYTNRLYDLFKSELKKSTTFVDLFARITHSFFSEEGLVLIDAQNEDLRRLESSYFQEMIKKQPEISEGVVRSLHHTAQQGYAVNLEAEVDDGHLFYKWNGERTLLMKDEEGYWRGKKDEVCLSEEELMHIAETNPHLLSNNVVTRPLMQDLVLPSLSFIAGPGEVGYWSALKSVFESLDIQMPPVMPRLSLTLLDRKNEKWLRRHLIDVERAVNEGVTEDKSKWIAMQSYPPIEELADEVKRAIERAHRPLKEKAHEIRDDIGQLAEKNLFHLFRDVEYLQERMAQGLEEKHSRELEVFDQIDLRLHPEGGLQERIWNILPFANEYGPDLPKQLLRGQYDWKKAHHVIFM